MKILAGSLSALLLATLVPGRTLDAGTSCEAVSTLALPNATITLAQAVEAGRFTPPAASNAAEAFRALPAFCRVAATLKPTRDSDIKIEVWMPASGWNGKFQAVGNGAFNGAIAYPGDDDRACQGLCHELHRHRPCRRQRKLRARTPGEADRFRMARGPRDDGGVEEDHRRLLRRRPEVLVLERLLRRWTSGDEGGATLPGRFRRHHRRRAGSRLDRACRPGRARGEGAGEERIRAPVAAADSTPSPGGRFKRAMSWTA